ncbi:MAG: hypothetical protein WD002_01190 [Pseudomonadales bacterium]
MDTIQFVKWSITALAVLVFQQATASQPVDRLPEEVFRVKYTNTDDMPDHIAYLSLMQNLWLAENESGREPNLVHIQTHLSINREEANIFLEYLLSSYDEMLETNRAVTNRMLCQGNKPKYETNKAYAVLDVLDDIKETNLRKHYKRALIEFGTDTGEELNLWLAAIKTGSSHHRYDHRRIFEHSEQSVGQVISVACNVLTAYVPRH